MKFDSYIVVNSNKLQEVYVYLEKAVQSTADDNTLKAWKLLKKVIEEGNK